MHVGAVGRRGADGGVPQQLAEEGERAGAPGAGETEGGGGAVPAEGWRGAGRVDALAARELGRVRAADVGILPPDGRDTPRAGRAITS
ncbi:hypothetical protein [Streptomyces sp. NPDC047043]|uniref:hypothetical protein n=1 Tax=Streptomyces sp. NPDC047043 TaxID=3154497 RepID=UPI0033E6D1A8